METKNIICFGFGQVAKNFIKKLIDQGIPFKLTTTSREESKNKKFENKNYESFQFTEEGFDKNFISRFEEADHILLSIAPINGTYIVIKNTLGAIITINSGTYDFIISRDSYSINQTHSLRKIDVVESLSSFDSLIDDDSLKIKDYKEV